MKTGALLFLAFAALASVGQSQDVNGDGHVTYLLPINVPNAAAGANGSAWKTELWVHNGSQDVYNIVGCPGVIFDPMPPCRELIPFHAVGATEKAFPYETGEMALFAFSAFTFELYPWQTGVTVTSRLYELSRHSQPSGVEIPIVREDRFFTKPSRFIAIPNSSAVRVALRVYDPRHRDGLTVRIDVLDEKDNAIGTTTLSLVPQTIDAVSPGYAAILDVASAFPQLAGVDHFDIRVTPLAEKMEYWALVSVTDQETQTVMLVTANE